MIKINILEDLILYITCMSKGAVGFIKLTLSPIFSFKDSLQIHPVVIVVITLAISYL